MKFFTMIYSSHSICFCILNNAIILDGLCTAIEYFVFIFKIERKDERKIKRSFCFIGRNMLTRAGKSRKKSQLTIIRNCYKIYKRN